jgi:RNA polymerase sigma factor (sigma-70 family)
MEHPLPAATRWELALHRRLAAGEEAALADLYDRYSAMVYGLAARVTRDRAAAEDITRDVLVHLWEDPAAFDPSQGSLRLWLAARTHRLAVDRARGGPAAEAAAGGHRQAPPAWEDVAEATATARQARAALDALPAPQRDVLLLAYFDGRGTSQIAELLGIPAPVVSARLRAGLHQLADQLRLTRAHEA